MKTSDRLLKVYRRVDGLVFKAMLIGANQGQTNDRPTYRILYVPNPCMVKAGDVIQTYNGEYIILLDQPDDTAEEQSFKAAYATKALSWSRNMKSVDPVSQVEKNGYDINMGDLYMDLETPTQLQLGTLQDTRYRFFTGQGVAIGDKVNGKLVKLIQQVLGVQLVFCE